MLAILDRAASRVFSAFILPKDQIMILFVHAAVVSIAVIYLRQMFSRRRAAYFSHTVIL